MKLYKILWLLMLIVTLGMFTSIVSAFPEETFDGDTVYINDSQAFISATPHTVKGSEPVIIEYETKSYTGNINFVFGYNGEYIKPYKLERFDPHIECYTQDVGELNETEICNQVNWTTVNVGNNNFIHIKRNLDGKTDWYAKANIPVVAGQKYKYKISVQTPYLSFGETQEEKFPDYDGKYDVAFFPSVYGTDLITANNNGHLYLLDPTIDLTTGLVSYWKFDSDATDSVLSNDGTVTGAVNEAGKINNGYTFAGSEQIVVSHDSSLSLDSSFSLSFWYYRASNPASTESLLEKWTSTGTRNYLAYVGTDGRLVFQIKDASTVSYVITDNAVSNGNFNHIVMIRNVSSDRLQVFVNGVEDATPVEDTTTGTIVNTVDLQIGRRSTGVQYMTGKLDEIGIWSKALTTDEITELYNSNNGLSYPFPTSSSAFIVTGNNTYNNSVLTHLNITIDGVTYTTTNGTINTPILQNSTQLHNFTIVSPNHFPITESLYNITANGNYEAQMFQTDVSIACFEYITNNTLSCDESNLINYNAGTYNITGNVTGYFPITRELTFNPLDNKTINFEGFANSSININALNLSGGNNVQDFTINITDLQSSWSIESTANGTNLNKTLISGRNYTLFFTKLGFESKNVTLNNFTSQNYQFKVFEANSINITIRKESDLTLITDSVTIRFSDENETITNYVSNTGHKYLSGFTATNYTISFISGNYSTRTVNVNFNDDHKDLTVYLIATGSDNTIFTFQDKDDGSRIEGVTLSVQKLINTTWTLVESLTSDITGRTSFDYSTDVAYRFIATKENYLDKNWTLDPILFSSYIIKLGKNYNLEDNSDFNGVTVYFEPKTFKEDTNTSINFTFSNPFRTFVNYGFNATWDGTNFVSSSGSNNIGSNLNATLEIVGSELNDLVTIRFYYELDNGETYEFVRTYIIQDSNTNGNIRDSLGNGYGLGLLERILLVVMIALLVAGAGAYFGGALAGGVLSMVVFGLFSYTGFISWWLTLPSLIIMFLVATWRSSS